MRWFGFNTWMKYTLLRWRWNEGRSLGEYAFPMLSGVDVAIRQEQLNEGLNRVLKIADVGAQVTLPEKNKTSGKKPYTEYYSWSTRMLAERMLAPHTICGKSMCRFIASRVSENRSYKPIRPTQGRRAGRLHIHGRSKNAQRNLAFGIGWNGSSMILRGPWMIRTSFFSKKN